MAYINAISYYLPKEVMTNEKINLLHPEWSADKISAKTGIVERHIADKDEFSSDMAIKAAELLFKEHEIDRTIIDYIILCTQSPDYFLPTTACLIQDKLKIRKDSGAIDINLGCSGYVYGLGLAKGLIETHQAENVLFITAETYSKFINEHDKSNKTIFGDAATATLVSRDKNQSSRIGAKIHNFVYSTDGSGANCLIVKNGGIRNRNVIGKDIYDEDGFVSNDSNLFMDGRAIFNFTATEIPPFLEAVAKKNGLLFDNIDFFILHQANSFVLQTIRKRSKIPNEKMVEYLSEFGNTVSSTIPIALKGLTDENEVKEGAFALLCGFGVGLSVGGTVVEF